MNVGKSIAGLSSMMNRITLAIPPRVVTSDLKEESVRAADIVMGLYHCIEKHVFHGDIKPDNELWKKGVEAVIGDLGNSKIIRYINDPSKEKKGPPAIEDLMKEGFRLESEEEHDKMKILMQALQSKREVQIRACLKNSEPQMKKLMEWKIYDANFVLLDRKKENELDLYLKTSFLPTKSVGYATPLYSKAICDYFWRCEIKNLERACNAFDMRAMGISLYAWFTHADIPTRTTDTPEYYQTLEQKLLAKGLPQRAVTLIRRLAEPMNPFDTKSGKLFSLPIEIIELKELASLLESV